MISRVIAAHLMEIGLYVPDGSFNQGDFNSGTISGAFVYYYYVAEAHSSPGYGNIYPPGTTRLIATIEPLNGILMLTWSGAFPFMPVQKDAGE